MRKLVTVLVHGVIEHSHVMYRTGLASKNKCEPHVKVTNSQHILYCKALSTYMLNQLIIWYHNWYMSAI